MQTGLSNGGFEFFTLDIHSDEVPGVSSVLDGYALFPPGFNKDTAQPKNYPLLVYVYGEPAGTTVTDRYHTAPSLSVRSEYCACAKV